jgi:DNA-binding NarL/FixJ family response regulator
MKILIVDDHAVLREGVRRLFLAGLPGVEIVEAADKDEALARVRDSAPQIVVLDINLGGGSGLELLRRIKVESKATRVVMFTMYSEPAYVMGAIRAGASGYISKSAPAEELIAAVRKVAAGGRYIDSTLEEDVLSAAGDADPIERLTNREKEILRLLGEGKSLSAIAETLGVAYKTVANSCSKLKEKLGIGRTADLIRFSLDRLNR